MPFNGSGVYDLPNTTVTPALADTTIDNTDFNTLTADLETALTKCYTKTGESSATANLPMGGFKHTNVSASIARTDYARVAELQDGAHVWEGTETGAADAYAITSVPSISAYAAGQSFSFIPANVNTGASTLTVSGLVAKNIKLANGGDPGAGDISGLSEVRYDGTNFILLNPGSSGTVPTKVSAVTMTPVNGQRIYCLGTDGGPFIGGTGKAAGYYDDNSVLGYGTRFKPTGGDGTAGWERENPKPVQIDWFKPDGVDDSVATIEAVASIGTGRGKLEWTPGKAYKYTNGFTVSANRVELNFNRATTQFEPTADAIFCTVDTGIAAVINQTKITGWRGFSNDTTYKKTAFNIVDSSGLLMHDMQTIFPSWFGNGSTFAYIQGREMGSMRDWYIWADKPLILGKIPAPHVASNIGVDHHNFHNMFLVAAAGNNIVEAEDGVLLTQVSFTGHQAWVGGDHGFYWNDTTSVSVSNGLSFENVRWEGGADNTKYSIYIINNTSLQGLKINGTGGTDRKGFYLRGVDNVLFDHFFYTGATECLNVDATVKRIESRNSFWQAGSTSVISGQELIYGAPLNPNTGALPPTFIYDESANASKTSTIGPVVTGESYTLAQDEVVSIPAAKSHIFISDSGNTSAYYISQGSNNGTVEINDWGGFYTPTKDNALTYNIYYDLGYKLQNKRAATITFSLTIINN